MGNPGERDRRIETLPEGRRSVFSEVAKQFGTPTYVYFQDGLESSLRSFKSVPAPFGITVRYAMKANPTAEVLRVLHGEDGSNGAHFDASTFNEVFRAIAGPAKIPGDKVRLTSKEVQSPDNLQYLASQGVKYSACSIEQLRTYGEACRRGDVGKEVGIRFNVGIGSGGNAQTSTGGENSPFGIYDKRDKIDSLLSEYDLTLTTVHLHIGSGSDADKQKEAMDKGLEIVRDYKDVTTLNMGGGFKVGRMSYEEGTNIEEMGIVMSERLVQFEKDTGKQIHLEVEPGTALIANAGYIVSEVIDIIDNRPDGMQFLVVNGGMNMNARPVFYGSQHPLYVIDEDGSERAIEEYAVVGINCESGDLLTPAPGRPDIIQPRRLARAKSGSKVVIGGTGAYCSSMVPGNYNSQQLRAEVMVRPDGSLFEMRKLQPIEDLWMYEN
jgi:diaminopimelate decarboxylase